MKNSRGQAWRLWVGMPALIVGMRLTSQSVNTPGDFWLAFWAGAAVGVFCTVYQPQFPRE